MGNLRFQEVHNFQYRSMQQFFGQMPLLKAEVDRWQKAKPNGRCFFVPTKERIQKVEELFQDFDIPSVVSNWDQLLDGHVQIVQGALQTGFELPKKTSSWRLRKKKFFSYNDQKNGHVVKQSLMRNV